MKRYLATLLIALVIVSPAEAAKKQNYFRVGSSTDGTASMNGGVVLMGGSTDVDAAFVWMCSHAKGGDFLIVRATGTDAYNPYIQGLCSAANVGANSVATVIVDSVTAANDPVNVAYVDQAEMIWIAGGDQSDYINFWKGSKFQRAIQARVAAHAPIGGTSAGLNVLTQLIYTAQASQGVTSSQALADPYNKYMSFDRDFITGIGLDGIIGDPHFSARDRMGRDLAFMCRIVANGWSSAPHGISVDEQTALLIDGNSASVAGLGNVYFLTAPGAPEVCQAKTPLTYRNIGVHRISAGDTFNVTRWTGKGGTDYTVSADAGVLTSTQPGGSPY
jgi:cyanophycinase